MHRQQVNRGRCTTTTLKFVATLLVAGAIGELPAHAHHSFAAEYDANKPIKLTGTVTKVEWTNPHCWFYIDVKNEASGKTENWALELGNPNQLLRAGWTRHSLKIGDVITVEGSRARDGSLMVNARSMILMSTGQRLFAGSSQGTNP
jgi:Family of unknown function (DUF6152)